MQIIAISNQKGGCGKTTSAVNIAASLASLNKRTLLVDLDPQAHATFGLGIRGDRVTDSIYNVLTDQADKKKKFLEEILIPVHSQLDLAPSHILLSTIEQEFTNKDESVSKLYETLAVLSFPYEFVVIDCPPSLGFLTFNALRAAQTVIVPIELSSFSLMGVDKLLSMIELIRVKLQHTPAVYALPTMVDLRTKLSKHMMTEIQRAFGDYIFNSVVHQSVSVKESQLKGVPVMRHDPKSRGAADYLVLTQEIISKIEPLSDAAAPTALSRGHLMDFVFKTTGAKEVHLVGDFNHWDVSRNSLLWQKEEGVWQKRIYLGPGKYRYKFVVDGQWVTDPENDMIESNPYGGMDSVLDIA